MRQLLVLLLLVFLVFAVNEAGSVSRASAADSLVLALGFTLLTSFIVGAFALKLGTPMITGYLLAGLLFGPHIIGAFSQRLTVFSEEVLLNFRLVDSLALGLIAFAAGGELKIQKLLPRLKTIGWVSAAQVLFVFVGVGASIVLLAPIFFGEMSLAERFGIALLLGVVATANSPATVVAVMNECGAKGPMSTIVLGITVLKDALVMVLFSITLIAARMLTIPGQEPDLMLGLRVFWELFGSIGIGIALGWLLVQYIERVGAELPLLLLALSFVSVEIGRELHLSGILTNIAAGFYVQNFSRHGSELIDALEQYTLPVFIIFFTVSGAKISVPALAAMWPVALVFIAARAAFTWLGTGVGARAMGSDPPSWRGHLWLGFIAQAGVSLGLAAEIGRSIPEIGASIQTLIIAAIAVNQIVGPITFKLALSRAGEVRM